MGDRTTAMIRFGGTITRTQANELVELLEEVELRVDGDGDEPTLDNLAEEFGDFEVNYGNIDEITGYCDERQITYHHYHGHGHDFEAGGARRIGERHEYFVESNGEPVISLRDIAERGTEGAIEYLEWLVQPLPQLTVVDDPADAIPATGG